jgi:hypothetical protein
MVSYRKLTFASRILVASYARISHRAASIEDQKQIADTVSAYGTAIHSIIGDSGQSRGVVQQSVRPGRGVVLA